MRCVQAAVGGAVLHLTDRVLADNATAGNKPSLTDFQLQLTGPTIRGYCLKEKKWSTFLTVVFADLPSLKPWVV